MDRWRGREAEKQSRIKVMFFVSHEGVYGSGVVAPFFLQFNTTWRWVVRFMQYRLYSWRKGLKYISNWRLGACQGRSERFRRKESPEPSIDQTIVVVTMPTTLSGLRGGKQTLICIKYVTESTFFHLVDTTLLVKKLLFVYKNLLHVSTLDLTRASG
jgi:hypothetical protein